MEWKYNLRPYNTQCSHQRLVFILVSSVYPKTEVLLQSTERHPEISEVWRKINPLMTLCVSKLLHFCIATQTSCWASPSPDSQVWKIVGAEEQKNRGSFCFLSFPAHTGGELSQPMSEMNRTARKLLREPTLIPRRSFHLLQFGRIQGELHTISQFQTCTNITSRMLFKSFKFMGSFCLFVSQ